MTEDKSPIGTGDDESMDRERVLSETVRAYDGYMSTGYAARWSGRSAGEKHIVAERDRWLLRAFAGITGTVLDLGCGDGNLAAVLERAGRKPARFVGMDLIEQRVAWAKEQAPWAEFIVGSADRIPLPDRSVDAVAALLLLSSVVDPSLRLAILGEVVRVVRPGGRFIAYDLRYPSPRNARVRPLDLREVSTGLPGWSLRADTLTLLPPIARGPLGATPARYRALASIRFLRSHLAVVATAPA